MLVHESKGLGLRSGRGESSPLLCIPSPWEGNRSIEDTTESGAMEPAKVELTRYGIVV